ncbi:MAG TPA: ABC transporter ATP-binding protein [Verrucomicrobiae bacterium]|nr:ABC transporter ATP-binding protein [Verrucomicrobiae bacterium]
MTTILETRQLTKKFRSGDAELTVLNEVSLQFLPGSSTAIVGPSGSGKSTLLALCAGLDSPSSGTVLLIGTALTKLTEDQRARLRNEHVGFVFQSFQLIPTLTALENVMVPLELRGGNQARERGMDLLRRVGLADRSSHYPAQLSGGEQQRVALARGFINAPKILFADEPTGNLDTETSHKIVEALCALNAENGTTLILVTHDLEIATRAQRVIRLRGGRVQED